MRIRFILGFVIGVMLGASLALTFARGQHHDTEA